VIGLDNLSPYYDVRLKHARNEILKKHSGYRFHALDLCDRDNLNRLLEETPVKRICHLAAQAGVRYSLTHPHTYQRSNIEGFINLLEAARHAGVSHLVYASSSSVYGANTKLPFSESDPVETPVSLYGATKRANELLAYTYAHLFGIRCTGLRFFTVYGPWGRPDMALFLFTHAILENRPIDVYNRGDMHRSFTYIDDIVEGVLACLEKPFPFEIFNLGNDRSASLMEYIETLEKHLGRKAQKNLLPMQPGDVPATRADLAHARELLGFSPKTGIDEGIARFVSWYREFYRS
jgi:UDP-glucuronate 4-epimerase